MNKVIHRADSRGTAEHGWLHSRHTFSFASYYNPERMGFGCLRVINDDIVEPGQGFGTHPHNNMEIVSVPLSGSLRHEDSMGNVHVIRHGEVQVMSTGTGIMHSEYNNSDSQRVNFLQIWVLPKERDIRPRYGQKAFNREARKNRFQVVVSPDESNGSVWINQDACFSFGNFDKDIEGTYSINKPGNGVYLFVIEGKIEIEGETLSKRDAIGLSELSGLKCKALEYCELLCIEVPMN